MTASALLLACVPAGDDEGVGPLVGPRLLALRRLAPRGHRMPAAGGATLTTTMRVVDGVHGHAAIVRTLAEPAIPTGLADRDVHMVRVRDGTNRRVALAMDEALLARIHAERNVALVAADDLGVRPSRTGNHAAAADLHLNVVHDRAHRHVADRHGVARLD